MKSNYVHSSQDKITESALANSAAKLITSGSVLFVTRSGILAHSFPVATNQCAVTVNQDLKAITPWPAVCSEYLAWVLRAHSRHILNNCSKHGTTVHSIEIPALKEMLFPIAPPAEQLRIVAKIEELFSELDKAVESLTTARERLEAYRQSVLKHAFEGKLTANWRGTNPQSENGLSLRQRLLKTRKEQWEQAQLQRGSAAINNERWKQTYPEPLTFDRTNIPALPSEWCWSSLDELVSGRPHSLQSGPFGSNLLHSEFRMTGVLVIGIDNVREGEFSMGSQNRISEEKFQQLEKYQARPGDLLVTVMASLGRSCVVPRNLEKAIITKHVYRISMEDRLLLPEFFNLALQSRTVTRTRMFENAQGQTRPGLNSSILRTLPVPLCSREEQVEVVKRLSAQLSVIDSAITETTEDISRSIGLRQAILQQAFSGKLIAQDPNDEPASVLLERIRAEKEKPTTPEPKKRGKGAAA